MLSLKLQAEFCSFGEFKQVAIRDRILAGLTDGALRQRLLNEENLTLQSAEKLIATWEIAGANARTIGSGGASALVASLRNRNPNPAGRSFNKLARVFDLAKNSPRHIEDEEGERRPVKTRLGYKQPYRGQFDYKYRNRAQMDNRHSKDWRRDDGRQPSRYADLTCDYCGIKGHIKRRCFKLKHLQKEAVNHLDTSVQEPSVDRHLSELLDRMNTRDSDSDSDMDQGNYACNLVTFINRISNPCLVDVTIEQKVIKMEIDCGSSVTVMNKTCYYSHFNNELKKCSKHLIVVNGAKLLIEGETSVLVNYRGVESKCT